MKTKGTHNYYVYILTNKNKTVLYIGVTNNLKERLYYHNNPEAHSKSFSHKYKCKCLIYFEHFFEVDDAIKREKQLKRWNREKKEFLIHTKNPNWEFLNDTI
ncbi:GIY-YIG nuclease family protein [Psychroserpens sp. S379A]|uniref:GIY-YIG nuclease family protein n=1 Tax=Psychroserpens sp. S379A TaxID=3415137 RepID=UPI003C79FC4F